METSMLPQPTALAPSPFAELEALSPECMVAIGERLRSFFLDINIASFIAEEFGAEKQPEENQPEEKQSEESPVEFDELFDICLSKRRYSICDNHVDDFYHVISVSQRPYCPYDDELLWFMDHWDAGCQLEHCDFGKYPMEMTRPPSRVFHSGYGETIFEYQHTSTTAEYDEQRKIFSCLYQNRSFDPYLPYDYKFDEESEWDDFTERDFMSHKTVKTSKGGKYCRGKTPKRRTNSRNKLYMKEYDLQVLGHTVQDRLQYLRFHKPTQDMPPHPSKKIQIPKFSHASIPQGVYLDYITEYQPSFVPPKTTKYPTPTAVSHTHQAHSQSQIRLYSNAPPPVSAGRVLPCGLTQAQINALQTRELTPEDYELLLILDSQVRFNIYFLAIYDLFLSTEIILVENDVFI
eukprot:TRINITY_DN9379_c1_g1_i1.p1 TRINITY_DN9379_c1_g1~~TRINITY_DN9379_c1_g1_i1.p1  ORF type:complete len:405 (-),score=71.07 TRINITY_DN9379_c1_g1_i1:716-1930(-)